MRIAWSIGHDPEHPGVYSRILKKSEHEIVTDIVSIGEEILSDYSEIELFIPEIKDYENNSAGKVLRNKIKQINKFKADLAIESHFNGYINENANGCETLYFSLPIGERFSIEGKEFAGKVQKNTLQILNKNRRIPVKDRGAKGMASLIRVYNGKEIIPNYAFLTQTKMPAVILEPLFITNYSDSIGLLNSYETEIQSLAMAVVVSVLEWVENRG